MSKPLSTERLLESMPTTDGAISYGQSADAMGGESIRLHHQYMHQLEHIVITNSENGLKGTYIGPQSGDGILLTPEMLTEALKMVDHMKRINSGAGMTCSEHFDTELLFSHAAGQQRNLPICR